MREPKIFQRNGRPTFYVEMFDPEKGKVRQINLGTDEAEALKEYHRRLANRQAPTSQKSTVAVIDSFLSDLDRTAKARKTYLWYKRHLDSFKAWLEAGPNINLAIGALTGEIVDGWLPERREKMLHLHERRACPCAES